jgi:hypothetical protein
LVGEALAVRFPHFGTLLSDRRSQFRRSVEVHRPGA